MANRKRRFSRKRAAGQKVGAAGDERLVRRGQPALPPANPPARNLPLLVSSVLLLALWLIFLLIVALESALERG